MILLLLMLFTVIINSNALPPTILHITDVHYDSAFKAGSPANCYFHKYGLTCCHHYDIEVKPYESASIWGNLKCDSPYNLINQTLHYINTTLTQQYQIDYVFWTGDAPGHHDFDQSLKKNLNAIETITVLMQHYFPHAKLLTILGNHGTWPIDQLSSNHKIASLVLSPVAEYWRDVLVTDNARETFEHGGYYYLDLESDLRIVAINSLYYDSNNLLNHGNDNAANQSTWLKAIIADSAAKNMTVWFLGHIFPGNNEATQYFTNMMINLTATYPQTLRWQFWGHTHVDQLILYNVTDNNTVGMAYVGPSLEPSGKNPGFRLYEYDTNNWNIINYHGYYVDLNETQHQDSLVVKYLYNPISDYGFKELNLAEWNNFAQQLQLNTILRQRYCNNYYQGYQPAQTKAACQRIIDEIYVVV